MGKLNTLFQKPDYSNSLYDNKNIILLKSEYLAVYILEELVFEEEECSLLADIYKRNRIGWQVWKR